MAAKRVGSVTLGLTLVVFGVMFLLSAFIKSFNYLDVIKFWPVIFISLGIEMLVHAFSKDAEKAKLDVPLVHHDLRAHALFNVPCRRTVCHNGACSLYPGARVKEVPD